MSRLEEYERHLGHGIKLAERHIVQHADAAITEVTARADKWEWVANEMLNDLGGSILGPMSDAARASIMADLLARYDAEHT